MVPPSEDRRTQRENQQPKVMYLLPWRRPPGISGDYVMDARIADDLFAPIDREEFVRGMKYRALIDAEVSVSGPASDGAMDSNIRQ